MMINLRNIEFYNMMTNLERSGYIIQMGMYVFMIYIAKLLHNYAKNTDLNANSIILHIFINVWIKIFL